MGNEVSFRHFEGELAATRTNGHFFHGGGGVLGKALSPIFSGNDHVVDVEQRTAVEDGAALEGNDRSGGAGSVHGQYNICGWPRASAAGRFCFTVAGRP